MLKKIRFALARMQTSHLTMIPVVISLIPLSIDLVISGGHYSGTRIEDFLIVFTIILWGFMGLPIVIRKEAPGLITLYGIPAVIQGVLIMVSFWFVAISVLIGMISKALS